MSLAAAVSPDSIIFGPEPVILLFFLPVTTVSYLWQITLFIIDSLHRYCLISWWGIIFGIAQTKYTGRDEVMVRADVMWKSDALKGSCVHVCVCVCVWCISEQVAWMSDQTPGLRLLNDRWWSHYRAHLEGGGERQRLSICALCLSFSFRFWCIRLRYRMLWFDHKRWLVVFIWTWLF